MCVTRRKQQRPGIASNDNTTHVPTARNSGLCVAATRVGSSAVHLQVQFCNEVQNLAIKNGLNFVGCAD